MATQLSIRQSLNKAFLKIKPNRDDIENFKKNLISLLNHINNDESEEYGKNLISEFLKDTYYKPNYFINVKDRKDLVIHNKETQHDSVGVIIEAKRLSNVSEMVKKEKINSKATQELLLYFLRERFTNKNIEIKNLIATNINEWFIFDAQNFEKCFAKNKKLIEEFENFQLGRMSSNSTDFFYKEIASKYISELDSELEYTYINIDDFKVALTNSSKGDDSKLIPLYKILSPQHLLKLPISNDSNTLNKDFYTELLHIIGLEEVTEGGKRVIKRKSENNRDSGSLIENAINHILSLGKLERIPQKEIYGDTEEEQLFNLGLELSITWINRILFLKLLEAQLLNYKKNDKSFAFVNLEKIRDFDELNTLFFQVLAIPPKDRNKDVLEKYSNVPYLNSSLFEPTDIEHNTVFISNLSDDKEIPIIKSTVLKDSLGKKIVGSLNAIEYIFQFLDSYNFASDSNEEIEESNKTLINASVLGLIFEKINGYKDGSFFTPSFITMYMCKETIRSYVIKKFNKIKNWNCDSFADLYNQIDDINEANEIINNLKICDAAVGSGHFLVSALNELIAIKSELGILQDEDGKRLKGYSLEIINDELLISDEDGILVDYNPNNKESQRIQETLFKEKKQLIENCLFGVDINPNSVKICRLRLWIELLKNSYYKDDGELETLPNIDINIKCGNSLVSRMDIKQPLGEALKKSKLTVSQYKETVNQYKNAKSKQEKHQFENLINDVKANFKNEFSSDKKINKLLAEINFIDSQVSMFDDDKTKSKSDNERKNKLLADIALLEEEANEIKNNKNLQNAFEWRFEFAEVLDGDGKYVGFDILIGNPPYFKEYTNRNDFVGIPYYQGKMDIWYSFACKGLDLLVDDGNLAFIATNNWVTNSGASILRNKIIEDTQITKLVDFGSYMIFDSASIQSMLMFFTKNKNINNYSFEYRKLTAEKLTQDDVIDTLNDKETSNNQFINPTVNRESLINNLLVFSSSENEALLNKISTLANFVLDGNGEIAQGVVAPQDFLNKKNAEELGSPYKQGEGSFILTDSELNTLNLNENELCLIKPFYTSSELGRYYKSSKNNNWLIYTNSAFKNTASMDSYPKLKSHLDKFASVITSDNKPYGLHRSRDEKFFVGEKIMSIRKSAIPTFTYTDDDCYVSQSFNVIKTARINLKYLVGLLNSKLGCYWLKHKGKMQGSNYQVDKEPLLNVPLIKTENDSEFIEIVNEIIQCKKSNTDTTILEDKLDSLFYKLYQLTDNEIRLIINDLSNKDVE